MGAYLVTQKLIMLEKGQSCSLVIQVIIDRLQYNYTYIACHEPTMNVDMDVKFICHCCTALKESKFFRLNNRSTDNIKSWYYTYYVLMNEYGKPLIRH